MTYINTVHSVMQNRNLKWIFIIFDNPHSRE